MKMRAWLLFGLTITSTALAQQPSFDLASDSIKKAVRDSAATQYASMQMLPAAPAGNKPKPASRIDVSPPDPPAVKKPALKPAPQTDGFISALFEIAFDVAVDSLVPPEKTQEWRACNPQTDSTTAQISVMCAVDSKKKNPGSR